MKKEKLEQASSNILRGIDIESSALILEEAIFNNCIIIGGRTNILKVATRQILDFVENSKIDNVGDKNILDYIKENVKLKEKYKEQQNEIEKMATTINKDSFRILELVRIIEEIAKACYLTWTQKEYDFLGIKYSTNHQITIKNIIEHFEEGRK